MVTVMYGEVPGPSSLHSSVPRFLFFLSPAFPDHSAVHVNHNVLHIYIEETYQPNILFFCVCSMFYYV